MRLAVKQTFIAVACLQALLLSCGWLFVELFPSKTKEVSQIVAGQNRKSSKSNRVVRQFRKSRVGVAQVSLGIEHFSSSFSRSKTDTSSLLQHSVFSPHEPNNLAEQLETPVAEVVSYKVKSGDTFSKIWKMHGADPAQSIEAAEAFSRSGISAALRAGDTVELQIDRSGEITGFRSNQGLGKVVFLERNNDEYKAGVIEPNYVTRERRVSGTIRSSFFESAREQRVPFEVIDALVDVMSARMEFRRDVHKGDEFAVVFSETVSEDGRHVATSTLKAALLTSAGRKLAAIRYTDKAGKTHFYDKDGKPIGNFFLRYPVQFTRISSVFSKSRFHPVLKRSRAHNGVDFAAPTGTPVRSVADGVVTMAGYNSGGGNTVKVRHGRYETAYLHLSKIDPRVKAGSKVSRGQVIGKVGMTGLATGPHLHFSFYDQGRYVDPLNIELPQVPSHYEAIPRDYLHSMLRQLNNSMDNLRYAKIHGQAKSDSLG